MKLFIIPGAGENTEKKPYKDLIKQIRSLGYKVVPVNPNWELPLSKQIFKISKSDIVFGFSRGALLAYIVTKKHTGKLAILASMTPLENFSKKVVLKHYGKNIATDLLKIKFTGNKTPQLRLAGNLEKIKADMYIPRTKHYLSKSYIKCVVDILKNSFQ